MIVSESSEISDTLAGGLGLLCPHPLSTCLASTAHRCTPLFFVPNGQALSCKLMGQDASRIGLKYDQEAFRTLKGFQTAAAIKTSNVESLSLFLSAQWNGDSRNLTSPPFPFRSKARLVPTPNVFTWLWERSFKN